jgi:hypothetical protein
MPIALAHWLERERRFWEASLERLSRYFRDKPRRSRRKHKN